LGDVLIVDLPDLAATRKLAASLAAAVQGGDLIALHGPLGIGKSELARGLIQARAGEALEVPSPTFTIVQDYDLGGLTIRHIDPYRLEDPDELFELGLEDAPGADQAWLVEWPERAAGRLAGARLDVTLEDGASPDARIVRLAGDAAWAARLQGLAP
jgi:tRNA threonylcarbamoyl adenosine modification protein YjeE